MPKKPTYDDLEQRVRELEKTLHELKLSDRFIPHERAMIDSELQLEELATNIPGVVYRFRVTGDHVYTHEFLNGKTTEIFGLQPDLNNFFDEFYNHIPEDEKELFYHSVREAVDNVEPWNYEGRFIKPDGQTIWFSGYSVPLDEGESIVFYGVLMDVTPRKKMESSLRLAQFCFDSAAVGIYHIQSDGRFLNVNAHAAAMLGYTVDELSGLFIWDIDPYANADGLAAGWQKLADAGVDILETTHVRKDGSRIPVEITSSLLEYDGQQFSICFVRDVSERKRMEQALKESEERLDLALSGANEGIWDWDIIEGTVFLDFRYYTMAGYQPNEFPATYDEIIKRIHKDDVEQVTSVNDGYLAGDLQTFEPEFRFRRKDGSYMWLQAKGKITRNVEGNPIRFSGTHTDITRRKLAEIEKEQLLKELQEALENVKTLSGLLPICASCKKIRDDSGYWNQLEAYIHKHSEAKLSHSICPDCAKKLYPEIYRSRY